LSQPNTSPQLQRESPAPRWSCKLVELLLQSWFGGAGALPNTPLIKLATTHVGPVWHSSASTVELFFRKKLHDQLHERGREPCFCSFTMCLTLWEWVFREADQRVGQRVGCLAIEFVKLLVKLLMKLYQTARIIIYSFLNFNKISTFPLLWYIYGGGERGRRSPGLIWLVALN
jgi:hypothetical protein